MSRSPRAIGESDPLDDYRWLVGSAGERWLTTAREELAVLAASRGRSDAGDPTGRLLSRLRKDLPAERARLVTLQIDLRERAKAKFRMADRMFFTRKGLEQATDEVIAQYKAARFSGDGETFDLCCGIGGDLFALARRGKATGVDLDPVAIVLAEANARVHGLAAERCMVQQGNASQISLPGDANWHCDPDRRAGGHRTTQVELGEPSPATIERLLRESPNAALKLAPAAEVPATWRELADVEWIGSRGECRQQVAWFGKLARHAGKRSATIVLGSGAVRTVIGMAEESVSIAARLGRYLYEPHAAVLAAGLSGVLSREHSLALISMSIAYLTGDCLVENVALDAFEVQDVLPLDRKQLKAYCREQGIGRLEVKKRGVEVDPERLRKEVIGQGDEEATLIVLPLAGSVQVIVARRIAH